MRNRAVDTRGTSAVVNPAAATRRTFVLGARSFATKLVFLYAWLATELLLNGLHDLPSGVTTLAAFVERWPGGNAWTTADAGGSTVLIARRHGFTGLVLFKSGGSAFVFDCDGRLIDWTRDDGDDPSFADRWYHWGPLGPKFKPDPPPTWAPDAATTRP